MEAAALSWMEWWKRHGQIHTFVEKPEIQTTGEEGAAVVNPQMGLLAGQLLKSLSDKYHDVRASAAIALGRAGSPAREAAVPKLEKQTEDEDPTAAEAAVPEVDAVAATATTSMLWWRRLWW